MKNRKVILRLASATAIVYVLSSQYTSLSTTTHTSRYGHRHNYDDPVLPAGARDMEINMGDITASTLSLHPGTHSTSNGGGPKEHPHAGARDAEGSWGYVADVYETRRFITTRYKALQNTTFSHTRLESHLFLRDDLEFESTCNAKPREGKERKAGWRLLTQKVRVGGPDPDPIEGSVLRSALDKLSDRRSTTHMNRSARLLCGIYTYSKRQEMANTIAETWGWKCDGFFAASTKTVSNVYDPSIQYSNGTNVEALGSVDLPHLGKERYNNMWQKTRSILCYMHDNYLEEFEFFFLSGDDTYVIVENLRQTIHYLGEAAWTDPLYLGHWVPYGSRGGYYCGGGPGYVLNRKSLEILVKDVLPNCRPDLQVSAEDRVLGECFKTVGITGNHSVDASNAQRFHGMDPHSTCTMKGDKGFFGNLYKFWGKIYGFRTGFNLTSSQSVSFHNLRTSRHLKRIHAILYNSCPPNTTIGDILLGDFIINE